MTRRKFKYGQMKCVRYAVILTFLLFTSGSCLSAQHKYEKESRIKSSEVPSSALQFIEKLNINRKIKWYLEESLEGESYEAKFKMNGKKHSVEFDRSGMLQDVEIKIKTKSMPSQVKSSIKQTLDADCKKHKICKVQKQYSGDANIILELMGKKGTSRPYITRYEITVKCKKEEGTSLYEYLFDDQGKFIQVAKIVINNTSNLEY